MVSRHPLRRQRQGCSWGFLAYSPVLCVCACVRVCTIPLRFPFPQVSFNAGTEGGVVLSARYNTNVSVLNATGDGSTLLVAQMTANVSIAADFGWEKTIIHSTSVSYATLWEMFPVNVNGWNQIIDWVVKQAGPKQSLGQLWDTYVKTPATPYIALDKVATKALEQWFVVSSDVKVLQLPPIPATV